MSFLGETIPYRQKFDTLQNKVRNLQANVKGQSQSTNNQFALGELTVPWLRRQHFWEFYLEKVNNLSSVDGKQAWRHLVPFRMFKLIKTSSPVPPLTRLTAEGYLYPHGVAVVIRTTLTGNFLLKEIVDAAILLFNAGETQNCPVQWSIGQPIQQSLTLRGLAAQALERLTAIVLGNAQVEAIQRGDPFTIATVIRGTGVDLGKGLMELESELQQEIHRALEGLCTWDTDWQHSSPTSLDKAALQFMRWKHRPGYILYGLGRNRVVWFPGYFAESRRELHKLSCYHANLTIAALQTNSLLELVRLAQQLRSRNGQLSASMNDLAKNATLLLGRMYGKTDTIYRSWSVHEQIKKSGLINEINDLRKYLGINTPLTA
ncbi:MAG TPA: hypothetical protein DCP31_23500 [Cyanobacteria bacterium UBA8543]|nr:hypothetical protein [Cyanobacteria bacterium UBA8543]